MIATPEVLEAAESVPHAAPLQPAPDRVQFTPLFWESLCRVAVKFVVMPTCTLPVFGDTVTTIGGGGAGVTVIVPVPALVGSATEVAVRLTVAGVGTPAGAV